MTSLNHLRSLLGTINLKRQTIVFTYPGREREPILWLGLVSK